LWYFPLLVVDNAVLPLSTRAFLQWFKNPSLEEDPSMDTLQEDSFVVYLRPERGNPEEPQDAERPLATCASYAEARQVQREMHGIAQECVIRYHGTAGGGD